MTLRALLLCCLMVGPLLWTGLSGAGPLRGTESTYIDVIGSAEKRIKERFVGGERACVIFHVFYDPEEGIANSTVPLKFRQDINLAIEVYDESNNLVARDNGKGDYAAVVWYPPQDGEYTIVLKNSQAQFNRCYLVIK